MNSTRRANLLPLSHKVVLWLPVLLLTACRPLPTPDQFGLPDDAVTNSDTVPADAATDTTTSLPGCGTGTCDGAETLATCPSDCAPLAVHLAGPCTVTGSQDVCGRGWFCVKRSVAGGGPICVADFPTWPSYGEKRVLTDFADGDDTLVDHATGLTWAKSSLRNLSWIDGMQACADQKWDGKSDWRMPTRAELRSLIDFSQTNPSAPLVHFDWMPPDLRYWTALPAPADPGVEEPFGLDVNFANAKLATDRNDRPLAVRCVRGGIQGVPAAATQFKSQQGDLTIFDRTTGLTWQSASAAKPLIWSEAKAACDENTLQLPGTGWRLPTLRELEGLLLIGPTLPNMNPLFATTDEQWTWSSSAPVGIAGHMWGQSWFLGPDWFDKDFPHQVRCVRGPSTP